MCPAMAKYTADYKQSVLVLYAAALDRLDAEGRQPDPWEESCLVHALSFIRSGIYDLAAAKIAEFATPVADRSAWVVGQLEKNPQRYTLARLRLRFEELRAGLG
jgi:hypothetical protein